MFRRVGLAAQWTSDRPGLTNATYFFLAGFFFSRFGASLFPIPTVSHNALNFATPPP
jgi:hypothetical protein